MMKRRFIFIFALVILTLPNIQAQTLKVNEKESESINIREFLHQQIGEIRARENGIQTDENRHILHANSVNKSTSESSNGVAAKLFFLTEVSLLTGLIILYRRKRIAVYQLKLKNNIKKLRQEKIGSINNSKLTRIRTCLKFQPLKMNNIGREITRKAKKISISKGEIHLAAKLQLLAGKYS